MARAKSRKPIKKRARKSKRSDAEYIASAINLSALVPSLRGLKKRKKLKPAEKSRITRREKQLKGIPLSSLFPVSPNQAKYLRGQLLFPGVQAIQLRNVPPNSRVKIRGKSISVDEENGRKWLYWHLSRATVRSKRKMNSAGKKAFENQLPIELVSELAAHAFKTQRVVMVKLWAHAGIVGDPHHTLSEFVRWVNEKWNAGRYVATSPYSSDSDPTKWVNGIAILLEDEAYAKKREQALQENAHVIEEMRAKGLAAREKERKRLAAKGLLDTMGTPLPKKKRTAAKRKKK